METHPDCFFDYLEIFNGPYASSPSVGRFCGTTAPAAFRSQTNSIRMVLFTDNSLSARGFRLRYSFTTEGCGGLLHSSTGYLATPNYPSSYPHNSECIWDINVDPGYHVALTFNPPFDMEHHGSCDYDFVEVNDAMSNGTLVPLGRYCENVLPPVHQSTGNRMVVNFQSDATTNGNGFSANWTAGCGGVITTAPGILLSPGFPNLYAHNLRCNYTLSMDPQHYIILEFDSLNFNMEGGNNCGYDYIAVYQGNSSNGQLLGKFCGDTAPQPLSALGQMFIQFYTDASINATGWRASYRVSECGGVFTEAVGLIQTPTFPSTYHSDHNCTWYITVAPDRVVDIKFESFDVEAHSTCAYDYLDIFNGPDTSAYRIGRYCGSDIPTGLIRSTGNTLTLNFVTDWSVQRAGFRLVYRTTYGALQGCGGYLTTPTGSFGSVDGDGDGLYENNLDCRWNIFGGDNKVIQLSIQPGMDIEQEPSCRYDYLKVYDGIGPDDPLMGTYCGNNIPPMITSTSNVLYVQFYSDVSVQGAGFNATYTQANALCGGTVNATTSTQAIISPNYPYPAGQNLRCRWTIDAPEGQQLEIVVTAINLQQSTGCSPEYLEIRDYPLGLVGRTVHACGTTAPPVFDSFGRTVQINYAVTDSTSTGFSLNYKIATCNRTYTGDRGQIFSPGWPGRYQINMNCIMQIQAPQGTTVSLYFNSFHIEPHSNCNYDYLEIRSGSGPASPVVAKYCGWMLPPPVFTTTNSVWLNFVTDTSVTYPGYDITYTATTQGIGCGGNITGINGSLTSPGYPGNYTESSVCNWAIQVPARRVITLTFMDMRIFDPVNCATDYVIVYDGNSDVYPSTQFSRYCGGEVPAALTTTGNQAYVKFVSDGVGTSIGFRMTFTS